MSDLFYRVIQYFKKYKDKQEKLWDNPKELNLLLQRQEKIYLIVETLPALIISQIVKWVKS